MSLSLKKKIVRSLKFSLEFANSGKLEALDALCEEYKRVVNLMLEKLENRETDLSYDFLKSIDTSLGAHFRQLQLSDMRRSSGSDSLKSIRSLREEWMKRNSVSQP